MESNATEIKIIKTCAKELKFSSRAKEKMKCVLCGGKLEKKGIEEEVRVEYDHVMVKVEAEVCVNCGERYFGEGVIDYLRTVKHDLEKKKLRTRPGGTVYEIA